MKKFTKLFSLLFVLILAFSAAGATSASAENAGSDSVDFYIFTSINPETGNVVYTVAADASAHLSNFTFSLESINPPVIEDIDASSSSHFCLSWDIAYLTRIDRSEKFIGAYFDFINAYLEEKMGFSPFRFDPPEYDLESLMNLMNYSMNALLSFRKSTALNGTFNAGYSESQNFSGYKATYNGVKNLGDEFAYEFGDKMLVDLFYMEPLTIPSVSMTVDGKSAVFPEYGLVQFTNVTSQITISAGTMAGTSLISLNDNSIHGAYMRPGDFDLDGEVTVRDLVAYQLYMTNTAYEMKAGLNNILNLQVADFVRDYPSEYGQYLQMYLCDMISYGEYVNRVGYNYAFGRSSSWGEG